MMGKAFDEPRRRKNVAVGLMTTVLFLGSCAHNDLNSDAAIPNATKVAVNAVSPASQASTSNPSVSVSQIGTRPQVLTAPQIQTGAVDKAQLTIVQLRIFADRCLPNSQLPPPPGLDCSEINLRMQRLLRDDDTVIDALITLGQLGRNDSLSRVINDLNDGRSGSSLAGGAIAGGLINGGLPPPLPEPEPELQEFLQENGLSINQGIISRLPQ